jgi:hypothetical protein
MITVALPVLAQTPTAERPVPLMGQLFKLPQPPNSIGDLQGAIDKTMTSTSTTVLVMDLDSLMLSRASMPELDYKIQNKIANLKSIQVRMFDVEGDTRLKVQSIRDLLKSPNWVRYSAYTSKNEEVEIWSARWGNSQAGVFLLSVSGKRIFTMNVGGNLGPNELVYLSGLFGIPNFKPELDVPLDSPVLSK